MIAYQAQLIIDDNAGKLVIHNYVDKFSIVAAVPPDVTKQIPPHLAMLARALNAKYEPLVEDA